MTVGATHYDILQVSHLADAEVIEGAYRRLARKYHPDVNGTSDAARRMKELNAAFEVLSDPDQRRRYDDQLPAEKPARQRAAKGSTEPTTTVSTEPLPVGQVLRFRGLFRGIPMEARIIRSESCDSLMDPFEGVVRPVGVFVVAFLDVYNAGYESDKVGESDSFRVRDSVGRAFDLAPLMAQHGAREKYRLPTVFDTIQPGFTVRMVFVFDVLRQHSGLQLDSLSPW